MIQRSNIGKPICRGFIMFVAVFSLPPPLIWGFGSNSGPRHHGHIILHDKKNSGRPSKKYKFGDISKSLINNLTGKDEYEFGDLSKWLDTRAKSAVNELTGKDEYQFGDLSRLAESKLKEKVNSFTGNEEYEFGDVSKEILRRVASGDYKLEDMVLLCKVLASFGVGIGPVASALPAKLLLDMLNVSLAQDIGGRLLEALSVSIDQRFKETLTGDANYKVGDVTKRNILKFVGKDGADNYEFGDITRAISKRLEGNETRGTHIQKFGVAKDEGSETKGQVVMDPELVAELEEWDRKRQAAFESESN